MSKVAIENIDGEIGSNILIEEANTLANQIRTRAFEFFLERGQADGFSLDNWFRAERDLVQVPEANIIEKSGSFHLHIAVPGFNQKDLKVTALPNALIVSAESKYKHSERDDAFHLCAFGEKRLLRRFDLASAIDTQKVHATVDDGLLKVTALKLKKPPAELANVQTGTLPFFEDN